MKVENICKLVPCSTCCGKGKVERYPHYSDPMLEKVSEKCEYCRGNGEVLLVGVGVEVVRDSSFKVPFYTIKEADNEL